MEGRMFEMVDCRCGSKYLEWKLDGWKELRGKGKDWIGLDWIGLHIGRISEIPLLRRIMIHTYLFFQTQKYNVTFVKL